jgi:hypothetical protein
MRTRDGQSNSSSTKTAITIAAIPVVGTIIVAVIVNWHSIFPPPIPVPVSVSQAELKIKGGKINDDVAFGRYDDLSPMMTEFTRTLITREVFNEANRIQDSIVGAFVKPIDTVYSKAEGDDHISVRNQHQNGIRVVEIAFDNDGNIIHLFTTVSK